jgi:hypothetical protein
MRLTRYLLIAAVAGLGLSTMTCGANEDEIQCEEAVARLSSCCPTFDPYSVSCRITVGCNGKLQSPMINITQSKCIQNLDCSAINANNVCGRVSSAASAVCP